MNGKTVLTGSVILVAFVFLGWAAGLFGRAEPPQADSQASPSKSGPVREVSPPAVVARTPAEPPPRAKPAASAGAASEGRLVNFNLERDLAGLVRDALRPEASTTLIVEASRALLECNGFARQFPDLWGVMAAGGEVEPQWGEVTQARVDAINEFVSRCSGLMRETREQRNEWRRQLQEKGRLSGAPEFRADSSGPLEWDELKAMLERLSGANAGMVGVHLVPMFTRWASAKIQDPKDAERVAYASTFLAMCELAADCGPQSLASLSVCMDGGFCDGMSALPDRVNDAERAIARADAARFVQAVRTRQWKVLAEK